MTERHHITVPPMAGLAPYCSCGWPETEGGKRMVWRLGDKTAAEHLVEVRHAVEMAELRAAIEGDA